MLGERRRGLEVLEFWEVFVRDLYGRFGNRGILCNAGILRISKLSIFNADVGFDSCRLLKERSTPKDIPSPPRQAENG